MLCRRSISLGLGVSFPLPRIQTESSILKGEGILTTLGTQLWLIYTKSLLRFICCSRPICTVAYVALSAKVQGGKANLAKKPKGGREMVEKDLVVKSFSFEKSTFCTSGWEGWVQKGVRGGMVLGWKVLTC